MSAEARIAELKLVLPPAPKPMANYVPAVRLGDLLYLSGHGPLCADGSLMTGKVGDGREQDVEAGKAAARQVGLAMLATIRAQLGSLDKVVRVIKVLGLVNATPEFTQQPMVLNGFSDLMVEVFGEAGRGARSAVGAGSLPGDITVEVEAILQVKD
jgi:enamine deaminase RidA (YjgF/YER057c/UK114 family)